jgi:hypothetical protein
VEKDVTKLIDCRAEDNNMAGFLVGPRIWVKRSPRIIEGYRDWAHYRKWVMSTASLNAQMSGKWESVRATPRQDTPVR